MWGSRRFIFRLREGAVRIEVWGDEIGGYRSIGKVETRQCGQSEGMEMVRRREDAGQTGLKDGRNAV